MDHEELKSTSHEEISHEISRNISWNTFKENKALLIFSIIFLVSLIFTISAITGAGNNFSYINKITSNLSISVLLILSISLLLSSVLAYFKKYKLMFLPIIIWLLIVCVAIRTTNIPDLKDITTGDWTLGPDLDPFLYLRHAQEIGAGNLQKIDMMRQAPLGVKSYAYINLMPWSIFYLYKIISIFETTSITYTAIIAPVLFFLISVLGFLLFIKTLGSFKYSNNKSWTMAILASLLYIIVPAMLHRTVAGVPEIESLGMLWFWFAFLFFTLAWKNKGSRKIVTYGILSGIFTGLMSWSWGGSRYIHMIIGLTALLIFLFEKDKKKNVIIFFSFVIPALIIEYLRIGSLKAIATSFSGAGFSLFLLLLLCTDLIFFRTFLKQKLNLEKIKLPSPVKSVIIFILLLVTALLVINPSFLIESIKSLIEGFLYPFGRSRVGLTVAENKTPYFLEFVQSFGYLSWIFLVSIVMLSLEATKRFNNKQKLMLNFGIILLIGGFAFSRYSSGSIFNGENFISKLFYIGSLILVWIIFLFVYIQAYLRKDEKTLNDFKEIDFSYILMLAFSFWALISIRGAIRLFVIISPMIIILSAWEAIKIFSCLEKKGDDLKKFFCIVLCVVLALALINTIVNYTSETAYSTRASIPSIYNQQWQKAMAWVRNETPKGSIFVHWWDYGYWVQTIGERPTVTDGAHANEWWDHTTARYLLTTPKPEEALSLMKTYNVSYLLIDSTDLGKYSAFSSIGSDERGNDRLSWIPMMIFDPKQVQETSNQTIRVYQGGSALDQDIFYREENKDILLPANTAYIGAVVVKSKEKNGTMSFSQPEGIFVYNGKQVNLPLRYLYFNNQIFDFKTGINSTIEIIPLIQQNEQGYQIEKLGAVIYLSEKTGNSLFSQLYLLNDPFKKYPTLKLAHSEQDIVINYLNSQGVDVNDFVYFNGFRGPIKIWEVNYPENILTREEFLRNYGEYASLDNLTFVK